MTTKSINQDKCSIELEHEAAKERIRNGLRSGQRQMADWCGGSLAVSAVPGAGKSKGMADAAALAIARHRLHHHHYLIVVTFTRSAAANLKAKIQQTLRALRLPRIGFFVYTLHGLALNIANRHRDLSGLDLDNATLITPNKSNRFIRTCVEQWVGAHPQQYQRLLEGRQFDGEETERLRRQSVLRTEVLPELAHTVIHEAKSSGLFPRDLRRLAEQMPGDRYEILSIAAGLYEDYDALLRSRDLIDYDDMILAAQRVLKNDSARKIWQTQVFAVFEDEAQDSTPLQSKLLEILASDPDNPHNPPNLIRVGDSNQAINSTFTPADPIYFRTFCRQCEAKGQLARMDRAGRSTQSIIDSANFMLQWVNQHYSSDELATDAPFTPLDIKPVGANDPQPDANPDPSGEGVEIYQPEDIYQTIEAIAHRVIALFSQSKEHSAAILVRENRQERFITSILSNYDIEICNVVDEDRRSHVPAEILALLKFLHRPHSPDYLKAALRVLVDRRIIPPQDINTLATRPEQFLYPGPLAPPQTPRVQQVRECCINLLRARTELPHSQLISFLASELKYNQAELATADKLADRIVKQTYHDNSIAARLHLLNEIVSSERFDPIDPNQDLPESLYTQAGKLTIITMHKAKGLDWDFVFIPFLHENMIPGSLRVLPQTQFLGDVSLAEVARAQIRANLHESPVPNVIEAWKQAGNLKICEEYRLLYVAMTRAKRLLWMSAAKNAPFTWSKPQGLQPQKPCVAIAALFNHLNHQSQDLRKLDN